MNNSKVLIEMIEKQLSFVGLKFDDILKSQTWYSEHFVTQKQHDEWRSFCIDTMRKKLRYTKKYAEAQFSFMNLMYGFRTKEE